MLSISVLDMLDRGVFNGDGTRVRVQCRRRTCHLGQSLQTIFADVEGVPQKQRADFATAFGQASVDGTYQMGSVLSCPVVVGEGR